jgi:hypothetical protein
MVAHRLRGILSSNPEPQPLRKNLRENPRAGALRIKKLGDVMVHLNPENPAKPAVQA